MSANGIFVQVRQVAVFDDHLAPCDRRAYAAETQPEQ